MRLCRDRRLDDPGPFDPARGDDLRFPDPGGPDLVLVEAGPVPLGTVTRSGGTSVPAGNDQAPSGVRADPARAASSAGMGERNSTTAELAARRRSRSGPEKAGGRLRREQDPSG
jgi:hypothetical protein